MTEYIVLNNWFFPVLCVITIFIWAMGIISGWFGRDLYEKRKRKTS